MHGPDSGFSVQHAAVAGIEFQQRSEAAWLGKNPTELDEDLNRVRQESHSGLSTIIRVLTIRTDRHVNLR